MEIRLNTQKTWLPFLLWVFSAVIFFGPFGIVSQSYMKYKHNQQKLSQSSYHALCRICNSPATHKANYSNNKTHYFCDKHWPAPKKLTGSGSPDTTGFDPIIAMVLYLSIYVPNFYRLIVHKFSGGRKYKITTKGSIIGVVGAILIWGWIVLDMKNRLESLFY